MNSYQLLNKTESRGNTVITFATPVAKLHEAGICQEMDVIRASYTYDVSNGFRLDPIDPNRLTLEWLYHKEGEFNWMPCPLLETPEMVKWLNEQ